MPQLDLALASQKDTHRATILSLPAQIEADVLPRDVGDAVRSLWRDPIAQEAMRRLCEFQLNDSAVYYFNAINRMSLGYPAQSRKDNGNHDDVQGRRVDVQAV
jgi:guanine nucleotide-binding protein G(i) subunit alpha